MQSRSVPASANGHLRHVYTARAPKSCGHIHHVGTCGPCQRAQLDRWHAQLAQVQGLRPGF